MGTDVDKKIGERVARLRVEKGLSQAAVAEAMREASPDHKWSQATVWAIEKGDRPLRAAEVSDLTRVIGGLTAGLVNTSQAQRAEQRLLDRMFKIADWGYKLDAAISDLMMEIKDLQEDRELLGDLAIARGNKNDPDWQSVLVEVTTSGAVAERALKLLGRVFDLLKEFDEPHVEKFLERKSFGSKQEKKK